MILKIGRRKVTKSTSSLYYTNFDPRVDKHFKTLHEKVLFERLEFLFAHFQGNFDFFIQPCDHDDYEEGNSMVEMMAMGPKVFTKEFDKIGVRYRSKSAYKEKSDVFSGKWFASYHDRMQHKTYYIRNHMLVETFLKKCGYTQSRNTF